MTNTGTDVVKEASIMANISSSAAFIPKPMFNEVRPNAVHQADLLYLLYDKVGRKTYKYALTIVDVAFRYKKAKALTDKASTEVAAVLTRIQ